MYVHLNRDSLNLILGRVSINAQNKSQFVSLICTAEDKSSGLANRVSYFPQ